MDFYGLIGIPPTGGKIGDGCTVHEDHNVASTRRGTAGTARWGTQPSGWDGQRARQTVPWSKGFHGIPRVMSCSKWWLDNLGFKNPLEISIIYNQTRMHMWCVCIYIYICHRITSAYYRVVTEMMVVFFFGGLFCTKINLYRFSHWARIVVNPAYFLAVINGYDCNGSDWGMKI